MEDQHGGGLLNAVVRPSALRSQDYFECLINEFKVILCNTSTRQHLDRSESHTNPVTLNAIICS